MSDNAIGRYKPDPVLLRAKVKDPELRRRTEELFRNPGGLCQANVVKTARSASPPPRVQAQTSRAAHQQISEFDKLAEIEFVKRLLGLPSPPVGFEIINRQEPPPTNLVVPTIVELEPYCRPGEADATNEAAESPQAQPVASGAPLSLLKIDMERRKARVREELGLAEDYRKNDEINLTQATILIKNFGLTLGKDGISFVFSDDYTDAQYRRVKEAIEYYAFCAGVRGDFTKYGNARELLEIVRARLLGK